MTVHQIITGALNHGEGVFAVGSVEGINFTACAVGCDVVIQANDFQRVQIIPGCSTGYIQVNGIDCCHETGKIAAAYENVVRIYEPMPLTHHNSTHKLDYQWFEVSSISLGSKINNISWNLEGMRLLLSTDHSLQLYQHSLLSNDENNYDQAKIPDSSPAGAGGVPKVKFAVDNDDDAFAFPSMTAASSWDCVWNHELKLPVKYVKFSPDGTLFATCGPIDNLVKIWYQDHGEGLGMNGSATAKKVTFSFTYLPHPNAVVGFEWRKTGRYTPRGSIMNVLITWCRDFISRIWCETSLPAETCGEMLLELKIDNLPVRTSEKERVARQSSLKTAGQRLGHKLKHLKKLKSKDKHRNSDTTLINPVVTMLGKYSNSTPTLMPEILELPTVVHFHLAVTIHPEKDCFLVPSFENTTDDSTTFAIHWLNNKELLYSLCVEKLLAEALSTSEAVSTLTTPVLSATMNNGNLKTDSKAFADDNTCLERVQSLQLAESLQQTHSNLDNKLEQYLRHWKQSSDILFTIHPLDGSLLVWTVDFVDNPNRQPTVVFSSRLPGVFPLSDAASLNHNVATFNPHDPIYVDLLHRSVEKSSSGFTCSHNHEFPCHMCNTIFLLTNHQNGTLNLWHLNVDEKSNFQQILSVTHKSRMCGHRFRINTILCHPVLPLFLTTSNHMIQRRPVSTSAKESRSTVTPRSGSGGDLQTFNAEMILWKVNPVGPLCKSGGVRELARINSLKPTAFSSIAWIPAILPSSTLGSVSNSPSSCFVAFDGRCLRVYQAVIDARALLAEICYAKNKKIKAVVSPGSSGNDSTPPGGQTKSFFKIVSSQSTARPGCIIELDAIDNSVHDWKNVQMLHVYHEEMLFGDSSSGSEDDGDSEMRHFFMTGNNAGPRSSTSNGLVIDRSKSSTFDDRFYLVALEKVKKATLGAEHPPAADASPYQTLVHVWLLSMSSQPPVEPSDRRVSVHRFDLPTGDLASRDEYASAGAAKLFIHSKKVCTQELRFPFGVKVIQACPAAGHLPSSSLYPACRAPYLLVTACSDDRLRYWYCKVAREKDLGPAQPFSYTWTEWTLSNDPDEDHSVEMDGRILSVSCAYSCRFACAIDPLNVFDTSKAETVNVEIGIYECESTGGTEWVQEDRLPLRNIRIPRIVHQVENFQMQKESPVEEILHHSGVTSLVSRIPSISNLSPGLRGVLSEHNFGRLDTENAGLRQMVRLDWVSSEDGSYVLTVSVGPKIFLFAPVTEDLAQKNVAIMHETDAHHHKRSLLRKASTIGTPVAKKLIKWVLLRTIELDSADGLPPLPLMLSWIRDGILVVGMESEMRVYNQWNISTKVDESIKARLSVTAADKGSAFLSKNNMKPPSVSTSVRLTLSPSQSALNLKQLKDHPNKKQAAKKIPRVLSSLNVAQKPFLQHHQLINEPPTGDLLTLTRDEGLFEAARLATPLLPQYHPRQLLELMYAGKTRRVKAILLHVLRFIKDRISLRQQIEQKRNAKNSPALSSDDESLHRSRSICRNRKDMGSLTEESLDYIEIDSIPPLPLHALLAAESVALFNLQTSIDIVAQNDFGGGGKSMSFKRQASKPSAARYDELFDTGFEDGADDLDLDEEDYSDQEAKPGARRRRPSATSMGVAGDGALGAPVFLAKHTRMLSSLLTHIHLPGLSSVDQMHLLAVSDTLSSFSSDAMDRLSQLNAGGFSRQNVGETTPNPSKSSNSFAETKAGIDTIDECGLRFLMALKQYEYLLLCLPLKQRAILKTKGLATSYIIWALHSDSQNDLLNSLSCMQKNSPKWEDLRTVGAGWWLINGTALKTCIEKVAKTAFQINNDPMDAAIYYLAMRKKNLMSHLYKSSRDAKMADFFANDFAQEKWKKAALKNAFVLMGKQRFEHAAAFFLLGEAFEDALQVCINNMNDLQLALVVVRLYEPNIEQQQAVIRKILMKYVLGVPTASQANSTSSSTVNMAQNADHLTDFSIDRSRQNSGTVLPFAICPDPFARSMACWLIKDYKRALSTLIDEKALLDDTPFAAESSNVSEVFSFYVYLRTHPLVVRQRLDDAGIQIGSTEKFLHVVKSMENQITAGERKLYFKTASIHFKTGCPLLALEVLCKLPLKMCSRLDATLANLKRLFGAGSSMSHRSSVDSSAAPKPTLATKPGGDALDWTFSQNVQAPKIADELELKWDENDDDEEEDGIVMKVKTPENQDVDVVCEESDLKMDIMAQQLKFIACLKIIMEELSTLASSNEVDGGQLRAQLYDWLEKEVLVLRHVCQYNVHFDECAELGPGAVMDGADGSFASPALFHEALKVDRANMTAKLQQAARRRIWLTANQQLLRTMLSYCSLHSSQGVVGLAAVRMELLLLLQELNQEPNRKSALASPIPLQSSFPLLAASVASIKTDIAGPLRYLHCQISDLLKSFCDIKAPPRYEDMSSKISMFYTLSQGLSSCIYESLCDIESMPLPKGLTSMGCNRFLLVRRRRRSSSLCEELSVSSAPHKWPGAENLLAYLSRERDEDVPNLLLLLTETWVSVYVALFVYAFWTYDARWLFRLVAHRVDRNMFSAVFGGGAEVRATLGLSSTGDSAIEQDALINEKFSSSAPPIRATGAHQIASSPAGSGVDPANLRARFNAKLFGADLSKSTAVQSRKSSIITTKNRWIQPTSSILGYFTTKPTVFEDAKGDVEYDSEASENEDGDESVANSDDEQDEFASADDDLEAAKKKKSDLRASMHSQPTSFAWLLIRLAVVRQAVYRLHQFLAVCGYEASEMGAISPLIHGTLRTMDDWKRQLIAQLESYPGGCPDDFLPNNAVERSGSSSGPPLHKYRCILDSENTPFAALNRRADPVKRLWLYLVRQEHLMDSFIRYIFKLKGTFNSESVLDATVNSLNSNTGEILKICQRELDPITAFAVSQAHFGWLVISTPRELQEIDIMSSLVLPREWLLDPTEVDLATNDINRDPLRDNDDYIMISPKEKTTRDSLPGRGATFLCKRSVPGVRRLDSHPTLPYYISGSNDGSVRLWEWGVAQPLFTPRAPGQFAKVTKAKFSAQGNKFGITDSDGFMCLWQISHGMSMRKPFLNLRCHAKTASDFTFLGNSSSLLATGGYSLGDANVVLWDTLLPQNKSLIHSWSCHPEGCTALMYVPQQQALLSGGRHGELCVFDIRERKLRCTIKAFDHATIKALALQQPAQEAFLVGSSDGDIKMFNLSSPTPQVVGSWPGEHAAKGGFSLRQVSGGQVQGVQQLHLDADGRMYSCGADCSLKVRQLRLAAAPLDFSANTHHNI